MKTDLFISDCELEIWPADSTGPLAVDISAKGISASIRGARFAGNYINQLNNSDIGSSIWN